MEFFVPRHVSKLKPRKEFLEHSGLFDPTHGAVDEVSLMLEFGMRGRLMDMMTSFMFRYNAGCKIWNVLGKLTKKCN